MMARFTAKRRAGLSASPTRDLHRKRISRIHHIQRVIAITDLPRAIRKNEIRSAKAELCPSPETDLDIGYGVVAGLCPASPGEAPSPHELRLFKNPDSTREPSPVPKSEARQSYFSLSPYSGIL